jgi:hypothetical protein
MWNTFFERLLSASLELSLEWPFEDDDMFFFFVAT